MKLVLGSASPRRKEILCALGFEFQVVVPNVDECEREGESPLVYLRRVVDSKFYSVSAQVSDAVIVCADTTVVAPGGLLLQKPATAAENAEMLRCLSGQTHDVWTAVCSGVAGPDTRNASAPRIELCQTRVHFVELSDLDIAEYVASHEGLDKAGGYGVQGRAAAFVERIEGSYSNVVGLPAHVAARHLRELGVRSSNNMR